jgi:hypothetical protein
MPFLSWNRSFPSGQEITGRDFPFCKLEKELFDGLEVLLLVGIPGKQPLYLKAVHDYQGTITADSSTCIQILLILEINSFAIQ